MILEAFRNGCYIGDLENVKGRTWVFHPPRLIVKVRVYASLQDAIIDERIESYRKMDGGPTHKVTRIPAYEGKNRVGNIYESEGLFWLERVGYRLSGIKVYENESCLMEKENVKEERG